MSTTKNISITDKVIWQNPYKGSLNTISSRIITSGLYFTYLDYYSTVTNNKCNIALMTSLSCSITNPIQLVKFNSWYNNCSMQESIKTLYKNHGFKALTIGLAPLIFRDFVFNYIYLSLKKKENHINNLLAVCVAITISSPINVIKNKKYGNNPTIKNIIKEFKFSNMGLKYAYIRMGIGFYTSQIIYDINKKLFHF